MNSTVRTGFQKRKYYQAILKFMAIWLVIFTAAAVWAESTGNLQATQPRIVIDPGHGGRDMGARGPTGLMEKSVTLEIARQLELKLEPQFQVVLTRSDDYAVDLPQRAATANQSGAALLVSIHTGSGFLHRAEGIGVFYYAALKDAEPSDAPTVQSTDLQQWEKAHLRHRAASIALADSIMDRLGPVTGTGGQKIQGAALKLLEGANLPAVLVEVGHITHPATEMNLSSTQGIDRLSHALAEGIRNYFSDEDVTTTSNSPAAKDR